jgi:hypothetical protein
MSNISCQAGRCQARSRVPFCVGANTRGHINVPPSAPNTAYYAGKLETVNGPADRALRAGQIAMFLASGGDEGIDVNANLGRLLEIEVARVLVDRLVPPAKK